MRLFCSFILTLIFYSTSSFSFYQLEENHNLSPQEKATVESFLQKTQKHLPETLKKRITDHRPRVSVHLKNLTKTLPPFDCQNQGNLDLAYGYYDPRNHQVVLNKKLLPYMGQKKGEKYQFPCRHKNMFRFAKAVLIHETGHLYDLLPTNDYQDQNLVGHKFMISDRMQYLKLSKWRGHKNKNKMVGIRKIMPIFI